MAQHHADHDRQAGSLSQGPMCARQRRQGLSQPSDSLSSASSPSFPYRADDLPPADQSERGFDDGRQPH